ncbi:hypothetical protein [Wolbachia endosymbiont of Folsomia candida]|nr:hypothetical protein [Wolbachia endosymbiont of Folsomia candida]
MINQNANKINPAREAGIQEFSLSWILCKMTKKWYTLFILLYDQCS